MKSYTVVAGASKTKPILADTVTVTKINVLDFPAISLLMKSSRFELT